MATFTVSQTFEIFGDPCCEDLDSLDAAETAADGLALAIANWLIDEDEWGSSPDTGMSNEIEFWNANLTEKPDNIDAFVGSIRSSAVVIAVSEQDAGKVTVYASVYPDDIDGVDADEFAQFASDIWQDETESYFSDMDIEADVVVEIDVVRNTVDGDKRLGMHIENDDLYDSDLDLITVPYDEFLSSPNELLEKFNCPKIAPQSPE